MAGAMNSQPPHCGVSAWMRAWWLHYKNLSQSANPTDQAALHRSLCLLKTNLSPVQRQQYQKYAYFEVTGGNTGKRYRIRHGSQSNVDLLDRRGWRIATFCFVPEGQLPAGDILLAQKLALELFETDALSVANRRDAD